MVGIGITEQGFNASIGVSRVRTYSEYTRDMRNCRFNASIGVSRVRTAPGNLVNEPYSESFNASIGVSRVRTSSL